jgi:SAM-dependent methyltransferase
MKTEELSTWFNSLREWLEPSYLSNTEPWKQSGMSGPEERWIYLRKPVADCVDKSGSFLDIGCANGYLLECCLRWTAERGIKLDPYGLDFAPGLLELARKRLPEYTDHFFTGNSMTWVPPRRFDFVRTELVYVPAEHEKQYIQFILTNHLEPGGKLLVANYGEDLDYEVMAKGIPRGAHPTRKILDRLAELGFKPDGYKDGHDPINNRTVRIAILTSDGQESA